MKIFAKILLGLAGLLLLFAAYIQFAPARQYDIPISEFSISSDSATLARGEYLVYGPAHCAGCHSGTADKAALEAGEKVDLKGGSFFDTPLGKLYIPNITPDPETGIGNLSNGAISRSMRYAVNHKGNIMVPVMPFSYMSKSDVSAIIAYLKSRDPISNPVPSTKLTFMGKALTRLFLKPYKITDPIQDKVIPDTTAVYGAYLANSVANCKGCHSSFNMQKMEYVKPYYKGGGSMDEGGEYIFNPPNLTPDPLTGHIYSWTEETFVNRFKAGPLVKGSPMPWTAFAEMSETDLRAIHRYLQTLEPVANKMEAPFVLKES